jgi:hypothetical protein
MFATKCVTCQKEVVFKALDAPPDGEVTIEQGETRDGQTATMVSGVVHVVYCSVCSRQKFLDVKASRKRG